MVSLRRKLGTRREALTSVSRRLRTATPGHWTSARACSSQPLLAGGPSRSHSLNHMTPRWGPAGPHCPNHTTLTPTALLCTSRLAPPSLHLPGSSAAWLRPRPAPRPLRAARVLRARTPAAARALPGPRPLRPHWACPGRAGRWEVGGRRAQAPRAEGAGPLRRRGVAKMHPHWACLGRTGQWEIGWRPATGANTVGAAGT